ncbi:MAG TPA: DUF2306 domain-containing protein [Reyranella sp.]|jgi:uncharacterized membrane protein|nr:DUF2306 domain-containing protein [Reyranella sp.]
MSLAPILAAGWAVQIHLVSVLTAFVIGTWMMVRPKGTMPHKALGRIYVALMIASAVSTFWIRGLGHGSFSFLHLLSIFVLLALPFAIVMARLGRVQAHRYTMIGVYLGGIWIAGPLTLLPGRLLHRAVFGS